VSFLFWFLFRKNFDDSCDAREVTLVPIFIERFLERFGGEGGLFLLSARGGAAFEGKHLAYQQA
jgi:hypothetical protein